MRCRGSLRKSLPGLVNFGSAAEGQSAEISNGFDHLRRLIQPRVDGSYVLAGHDAHGEFLAKRAAAEFRKQFAYRVEFDLFECESVHVV